MPTRLTTNFPPLTDFNEFQSLTSDLCALEWEDPETKQFGRTGQAQHGIDVYGKPTDAEGKYRGAQCKLRTRGDQLTESEIEKEVADAHSFRHPIDKLIIVTDGLRDTHTQLLINEISDREVANGGFKVAIWFWNDVRERLAAYPRLIVKYYGDYFASLTTLETVEQLVDTPLTVFLITVSDSVEECLKFRGVHVIRDYPERARAQVIEFVEAKPDGLVFYLPDVSPGTTQFQQCVAMVHGRVHSVEEACPAIVILPSEFSSQFESEFMEMGGEKRRLRILPVQQPHDETASTIFEETFKYGYARRGSLATVGISARTMPSRPDSALIDLDWRTRLSTRTFPTEAEWKEHFVPALQNLTGEVTSLREGTRLHIESKLPVPAAIAIGFFLNIRTAHVGVWARRIGVSDFKYQFWASNGPASDVQIEETWEQKPVPGNDTAIVEISTGIQIHEAVRLFVRTSELVPGAWLQIHLPSAENATNISEGEAVAFANRVAAAVRQLNANGITDVHIFARIPSALGILVGQRLHACGRVHLYWFLNPDYRYAFMLT